MPRSLKEKVNVLLAKIVNFDFEFVQRRAPKRWTAIVTLDALAT